MGKLMHNGMWTIALPTELPTFYGRGGIEPPTDSVITVILRPNN